MINLKYCAKPWQILNINRLNGPNICCFAEHGSSCFQNQMPSDIIEQDWESDGILWKCWNSIVMQQARKQMIQNGISSACGIKNRCFKPHSLNHIFINCPTNLQKENTEKIEKSILNRESIVNHYPEYIELTLEKACNLQCPYCDLSNLTKLDVSKFKNELQEFMKRAKLITLLGGEPTICSNFDLIVNIAKITQGAKINIITNGHFIKSKVISNIDLFHDIAISLDATNSDTYKLVRPPKSPVFTFDHVIENINSIPKQKVNLILTFVISGYNYKEMPDMIKLGHTLGAKIIFFQEILNYKNYNDPFTQEKCYFISQNPNIVKPYLDIAIKESQNLNIIFEKAFFSL